MAVFKKTARAEEDLIDIWLYISQDNPAAADSLLDTFEEKGWLLAENTKLGRGGRTSLRSSGICPWGAI